MGAYGALMRQVDKGKVKLHTRHEMLELVIIDGKARGIITRNLDTGEIERYGAHAVILATGGFGKIYYLSTLAMGCNGSAIWRAHKKGAYMACPSWTQIHPTSLPQSGEHQSKLTLMSESLRNDGRIWVPAKKGDTRNPNDIPEEERDYYLERKYPAFGNLAPRDISSRAAKERIDSGHGVGPLKNAVYLDFKHAIKEYGEDVIRERYGNLFRMYEKITGVNAYREPMKISPAAHFSMGGLWVDYELGTTIPGLYALGECNFSDHGANRLGANSLLQACVDGYFIIPYTIGNYLADDIKTGKIDTSHEAFDKAEMASRELLDRLMKVNGTRSVDHYHKILGKILTDKCSVTRSAKGLEEAIGDIRELREDFWKNVRVTGTADNVNSELEKAGRVADYLELGELMCLDALTRNESCGAHFREEYQTDDGEAMRDDNNYGFISCWEHAGEDEPEILHREELIFEEVKLVSRDYKR
jgi:succinate dehydrogenase / fumarate reductase flavoprotein subunit